MKDKSKSDKKINERRVTERRIKKRRVAERGDYKPGDSDKRVARTDRRVTILNRDKKEVSDRRS
jgi:hypothetical protein